MDPAHLIGWISAALEDGVLSLVLVILALGYQTVQVRACVRRDALCSRELVRMRLAVVRLRTLISERLGEHPEPIPSIDELMSDRRGTDSET